eukprot:scaffold13479_cov166-Amphora_coffeaeformis.AAC.5
MRPSAVRWRDPLPEKVRLWKSVPPADFFRSSVFRRKSVISRKGGALLFRLSCKGFVMQSNTESGANGAARLLSISFFFHAIPMLSRVLLYSIVVFISTRNLTTLLSLTPMLSATGGLGTCSRTFRSTIDRLEHPISRQLIRPPTFYGQQAEVRLRTVLDLPTWVSNQ